jgi:hypothetical protein
MRKFCKIIIYTLDFHHSLMSVRPSRSGKITTFTLGSLAIKSLKARRTFWK